MAEGRRLLLAPQLDMEQILLEAQHRWLRPAEICEILQNFQKFHIAPEPPNRPPSGSLFLFDRKVLRYFRKDGHNWRKKKDGKTVKEAHERLKAESVDVLHCYYAHGEENENFQRRSYWLLDEDYMHIVLVHYLQIKGSKANINRSRDPQGVLQLPPTSKPASSNSFTNRSPQPSQITDAESPNSSSQTIEYEDAESDNYQRSTRYYPYLELQQYDDGSVMDSRLSSDLVTSKNKHCSNQFMAEKSGSPFSCAQGSIPKAFNEPEAGFVFNRSRSQIDYTIWDGGLESCTMGFQGYDSSFQAEATNIEEIFRRNLVGNELFADGFGIGSLDSSSINEKTEWQLSGYEIGSLDFCNVEGNTGSPLLKQNSFSISNKEEAFKKYDSFSRWMNDELEEVDDSNMKPNSETYWNTVEGGSVLEDSAVSNPDQLGAYLIGPSVSQDQFFSISDFSPNWTYSGSKTEILILGTFLKSRNEVKNYRLSCMFGEVEVPAEVLSDGILRCHAPTHNIGRVPFYITCSNRLACSEVREFEFRMHPSNYLKAKDSNLNKNEIDLHIRFETLLSLEAKDFQINLQKVGSSVVEQDSGSMLTLSRSTIPFLDHMNRHLAEELLKERLHVWLIQKVAEDGKGPVVLDKEGQGVIHLAAALGYDWAIEPIIAAGVSIDFRDVHGWTALHWAACWGRERTVVLLVTLDAAPGALTDPTPEFPSGRTPADLASCNHHKGIAGFLAESSLTSHLSKLMLDSKDIDPMEVPSISNDNVEQSSIQLLDGNTQHRSLKDSLDAVRNAAQAVARIHQVFRVQSFQRNKIIQYGNEKCGLSNEQVLELVSVKSSRSGQHDSPANVAAIRIQNKFRGWKGRKEFLITRQRIIKIQAHVRGHQVRKHYRKIIWSVGIVEKAILRWRRKRSGLRGFRQDVLLESPSTQKRPTEEDYDFLKDGRKQTEARLDKALARVKSMVQYPEARDQYQRLMTIVTEIQESKVMQVDAEDGPLEDAHGDLMLELQGFLEDDIYMHSA